MRFNLNSGGAVAAEYVPIGIAVAGSRHHLPSGEFISFNPKFIILNAAFSIYVAHPSRIVSFCTRKQEAYICVCVYLD